MITITSLKEQSIYRNSRLLILSILSIGVVYSHGKNFFYSFNGQVTRRPDHGLMHTGDEQLSPVVVIHKPDYEKSVNLSKEGRTFHEAICGSKNAIAPSVPCGTLFSRYRDLQCIGSWRQGITSILKQDHHLAANHGFLSS